MEVNQCWNYTESIGFIRKELELSGKKFRSDFPDNSNPPVHGTLEFTCDQILYTMTSVTAIFNVTSKLLPDFAVNLTGLELSGLDKQYTDFEQSTTVNFHLSTSAISVTGLMLVLAVVFYCKNAVECAWPRSVQTVNHSNQCSKVEQIAMGIRTWVPTAPPGPPPTHAPTSQSVPPPPPATPEMAVPVASERTEAKQRTYPSVNTEHSFG